MSVQAAWIEIMIGLSGDLCGYRPHCLALPRMSKYTKGSQSVALLGDRNMPRSYLSCNMSRG